MEKDDPMIPMSTYIYGASGRERRTHKRTVYLGRRGRGSMEVAAPMELIKRNQTV